VVILWLVNDVSGRDLWTYRRAGQPQQRHIATDINFEVLAVHNQVVFPHRFFRSLLVA
jgi:hypothetical protein